MTELLANLGTGFAAALEPVNFAMIVVGLSVGIVAGALPGITMLNSIVLVLPFTYFMSIVPAILLMIGIYCGGIFGGSITAILFNIPGDPMNVPTAWEGYRLARRGQARYALGLAILASGIGGLASALFLALLAPPFARVALGFSSVEFFAVVVFGLASVSVLGQSSMTGALIALFAGMLLGAVGTEQQYGVERLTLGLPVLRTGVDFVTVLIGLFAIGEVLEQVATAERGPRPSGHGAERGAPRLGLRGLWPWRGALLRGTGVGIAVGGLAGAGATVSSFVAYGLERQVAAAPELFGDGHPGGLVAAESANNGSTGGAMIHLLTLGIPGSAATAVMMGAFLIHGIQPGPLMFTRQTREVYAIIAGMVVANVLMIALGYAAAQCFAQLMRVPAALLNAFIVTFCFLGAFALRNDMADVWLAMGFGVLGFVMRRFDLPIPPMVMGIILGPMAEQFFLTSMVSHGNDLTVFVTRPVSAVVLSLAVLVVAGPLIKRRRAARAGAVRPETAA